MRHILVRRLGLDIPDDSPEDFQDDIPDSILDNRYYGRYSIPDEIANDSAFAIP